MESKRIFIAIKINNTDQIRKIFRQVQLDLKDEWIKWVDLNGLHITLSFLGATDARKIELIKNRLKKAGSSISPFSLQLKSLGAFPSVNRARILWLGVKSENTIYELRNEILKQLEYIADLSESKFSPHVTLGRIKHGVKQADVVKQKIGSYQDWCDKTIVINEFVLMESKSTEHGPVYEVLEKFGLEGS